MRFLTYYHSLFFSLIKVLGIIFLASCDLYDGTAWEPPKMTGVESEKIEGIQEGLIENKKQKVAIDETGGNPLDHVTLPKDGVDEFARFPDKKPVRPDIQKGKEFLNLMRKWRPNKIPATLTKDLKPWKLKLNKENELEEELLKNSKPAWMKDFKQTQPDKNKFRKVKFNFG